MDTIMENEMDYEEVPDIPEECYQFPLKVSSSHIVACIFYINNLQNKVIIHFLLQFV